MMGIERANFGERNGKAKLTEGLVRELRRIHAAEPITLRELREQTRLPVTLSAIWRALHSKRWGHI